MSTYDDLNSRKEQFTKDNYENIKRNLSTINLYTALHDTLINIPALYLAPYINGDFNEPILTDSLEIREIANFKSGTVIKHGGVGHFEPFDKLITVSDVEQEFLLRIENDIDDVRISLYNFDSSNKEKYLKSINQDSKDSKLRPSSKKETLMNLNFNVKYKDEQDMVEPIRTFELQDSYVDSNNVNNIIHAISMLHSTYKVDKDISLAFDNYPSINMDSITQREMDDFCRYNVSHKELLDFDRKLFRDFNNKIKGYYIKNMIDILIRHASFIENEIFNKELGFIDKIIGKQKPILNKYYGANTNIPYYENCPLLLTLMKKTDETFLSIDQDLLLKYSERKREFELFSLETRDLLLSGGLNINNGVKFIKYQKNINLLSVNLFNKINTLSPNSGNMSFDLNDKTENNYPSQKISI